MAIVVSFMAQELDLLLVVIVCCVLENSEYDVVIST